MTRLREIKTTFTAGEVSPELLGRGDGRLIAFEFNTEQTYLLVLTNGKIDVYANGINVANIDSPWTTAQVKNVAWTQSADTLLLTHPDTPPKTLSRNVGGTWNLSDWQFFTADNVFYR